MHDMRWNRHCAVLSTLEPCIAALPPQLLAPASRPVHLLTGSPVPRGLAAPLQQQRTGVPAPNSGRSAPLQLQRTGLPVVSCPYIAAAEMPMPCWPRLILSR